MSFWSTGLNSALGGGRATRCPRQMQSFFASLILVLLGIEDSTAIRAIHQFLAGLHSDHACRSGLDVTAETLPLACYLHHYGRS